MLNPQDLVVWSDESMLVVHKPAGLLVIPGGYDPSPCLLDLLQPVFGRLWTVHRLDRETSGVLIVARSAQAHRALNTQFQERQVSKTYHALVNGVPLWQENLVDLALRANVGHRHRTVVDPSQGKPSVTTFQVLERFAHHALVQARPRTGRRHQVRVHLATLGTPIVGDVLYGGGEGLYLSSRTAGDEPDAGHGEPVLTRVGLHAVDIALEHPLTHAPLQFAVPYPRDMSQAVCQLRRGASTRAMSRDANIPR